MSLLSFYRIFPVDLKSEGGRVVPASIRLGIRGPVHPESGMTLNLVRFDAGARALILKIESKKFATMADVAEFAVHEWQITAQKNGVTSEAVEIYGRFGRLHAEVVNSVIERSWILGRRALDPMTQSTGRLYVHARTREHAKRVLNQLRTLPSYQSTGLLKFVKSQHQEAILGVREIGFRARKKAWTASVRVGEPAE